MPGDRFSITWQFTDAGQRDHMKLGNSVQLRCRRHRRRHL
jgi:hypothetical protein